MGQISSYIIGKTIELETDHKPLLPLLSSKDLDAIPPRILRLRLRLMRYSFTIRHVYHVCGKYLYTADVLSRSPSPAKSDDCEADELKTSAELFISTVVSHLPATPNHLKALSIAQSEDKFLQQVKMYCKEGWPDRQRFEDKLKPFWFVQNEFSVNNDLLLHGSRIVVPELLQQELLGQLHEGHQGIVKS